MFSLLKYKSVLSYIIVSLFVFLGVGVVFGSNFVFDVKISNIEKLSKNIFIDSENLKNNLIVYTSTEDLSSFKLKTDCSLYYKYVGNKLDKYYFQIKYGNNCLNPILYLEENGDILLDSKVKINLFSKAKIFDLFSDLDSASLEGIKEKILKDIKNKTNIKKSGLAKLKIERAIQENNYKLSILNEIIYLRKQKYLIPVSGNHLPHNYSKIPNSPRPYRNTYTDGVHHGWDFDTEFRHDVIAIDSGIIVRVVSGFEYYDLIKIKKTGKLTFQEELNNLDILRGNQIWLKTAKGDVAFYSHLDYINLNIKEGSFVNKGDIIGKVGITGVPDKNYKDYHLHFPIHKNPYIVSKVGKYSFNDYMKWDWYYKNKTASYILANQINLFEN